MSFGSSNWGVRLSLAFVVPALTQPLKPWVLDEKESIEIMKAAWDRGVNTIDTANVYSNGASEVAVGKFIKQVRNSVYK